MRPTSGAQPAAQRHARTSWRATAGAGLLALLAGCAHTGPTVSGSSADVAPAANDSRDSPAIPGPLWSLTHRALKTPEGASEWLRLRGTGVQIFRCEARDGRLQWVYRLPEAELRDGNGKLAARHGAKLSFEHVDGSRLVGEIEDHVGSPLDNALPWLLIRTRSFGKGSLEGVSYVQRIDTIGGMPPDGCEAAQANQVLRVAFSADFVFYH